MQPQILVPYDFGPASQRALAWAADLQRTVSGLPLHVMHVLDPAPLVSTDAVVPLLTEDEIDSVREELKQAVRAQGALAATEVVLAQHVPGAILAEAHRLHANLIVMGTHGRSGLRRAVLGSAAEYVVRHAECPVVTLRGAPAEEAPARAA
jgi:nucleotide-binding universal stress UspA family protein